MLTIIESYVLFFAKRLIRQKKILTPLNIACLGFPGHTIIQGHWFFKESL